MLSLSFDMLNKTMPVPLSTTLCLACAVPNFTLPVLNFTLPSFASALPNNAGLCLRSARLRIALAIPHSALPCHCHAKLCFAIAILGHAMPLHHKAMHCPRLVLEFCFDLFPYQQNAFMSVGMAVLYRRRISPLPAFPASILECTAPAQDRTFFKFVFPAVEDSLHTDSSSHLNLP